MTLQERRQQISNQLTEMRKEVAKLQTQVTDGNKDNAFNLQQAQVQIDVLFTHLRFLDTYLKRVTL